MADAAVPPVTADPGAAIPTRMPVRQLRLAPVMTGGTSLAVWMGGVTNEVYALYRSPREPGGSGAQAATGATGGQTTMGTTDATDGPVGSATAAMYRRLLAATRTEPVIDVVTGTSAGGLNGTLLAMAVHLDLPLASFAEARETWMRAGDLAALLRPTGESDPPSLLRGEDYFRVEVERVLDRWRRTARLTTSGQGGVRDRRPEHALGVDLVTTYTRIVPVPVARVDDFDEGLNEVSYAGTLRFVGSDLDADDATARLAIAARTSASIPGVFEPSFLPSLVPESVAVDAVSGRPNFARHQPPDVRGQSRWAVDGGLVVNLPLRYVLDRIFGQPATGRVRRVVVYVSPTPSPLRARRSDDPAERPSIAASALTIVNAPRAEGISSDVDAIRQANRTVAQQRTARRTLGALLDPIGEQSEALYPAYREWRATTSVDRVVAGLLRRFAGDRRFDEAALRDALLARRAALLPDSVDSIAGGDRAWGWGISTIEQAASVVLGIVNQALDADARSRTTSIVDRAATLGRLKQRVHENLAVTREIRDLDDRFWMRLVETTPVPVEARASTVAADRVWVADRGARRDHYASAYDQWPFLTVDAAPGESPADVDAKREAVFRRLRGAHRGIAVALVAAAAEIDAAASGTTAPAARARDRPPDELRDELRAFVPTAATTEFRAGVREAEQRLVRFHVVATLMTGELTAREQGAELMQISFNAPNALDPQREPADKLVGPELARLGAFLKGSWRANDWFWGRMDGAARLARLLVDPRRVWEVWSVPGGDTAAAESAAATAAEAMGVVDDTTDGGERNRIVAELAALLAADDAAGHDLAVTTAVVVRRLQLAIARDELPNVRDAVLESADAGGNERGSRRFLEAMPAPRTDALDDDQVAHVVTTMRIGTETARSELGSNLMVRTVTRTATVATNALTGTESGLAAVQAPLRALRAPLRVVSAVVGTLSEASLLARWLSALILGGAGAVLAVSLAGVDVNGVALGAAAILFVGALVVALVRLGTARFAVLFSVLAIPVVLALVGESMADVVYDEFDRTTVEVSPSTSVSEFRGETTVTVLAPATVRTAPTTGLGVITLDVDDDTVADLLVDAERATVTTEQYRPWWKSALVERVGPLPLAGWALVVVAVILLGAAARRPSWRARAALLGTAAAAVAGAVVLSLWGERLLTGRVRTSGRRQWVVERAEQLGDWRLEILLVVLVGLGAAFGLGSATVRRSLRRR